MTPGVLCLGYGSSAGQGMGFPGWARSPGREGNPLLGAPLPMAPISKVSQLRGATSLHLVPKPLSPVDFTFLSHLLLLLLLLLCCLQGLRHLWPSSSSADPHCSVCMSHVAIEAARSSLASKAFRALVHRLSLTPHTCTCHICTFAQIVSSAWLPSPLPHQAEVLLMAQSTSGMGPLPGGVPSPP